jgi:hypothetical protein
MQFAENVQENWQEGYCFIMKMQDAIQPEQPRQEFKNYSGNFLNICLTAWTWLLVTAVWSAKNHLGDKHFADDKEVEKEAWKRPRQQSKESMTWVSKCWQSNETSVSMLVEDMSRNVLSRFEYHMFYVLYPFVTYILTLLICSLTFNLYRSE